MKFVYNWQSSVEEARPLTEASFTADVAVDSISKAALITPNTHQEWLKIAAEFYEKLNFPHTLGAMDGKHIQLQAPFSAGTDLLNNKSIMLFAVVDANYKFIFVEVGSLGRISDGDVLNDSILKENLENGSLNFPPLNVLEQRNKPIPYYFVADAPFPLGMHIMKPYPGTTHSKGSKKRIFNYRLSRCQRVVENAFGIISDVFRILTKPMLLEPDIAQLIVMTIVHLHNFLRTSEHSVNLYMPPGTVDIEVNGQITPESWRSDPAPRTMSSPIVAVPYTSTVSWQEVRNEIAEYCCSNGRIHGQDNY